MKSKLTRRKFIEKSTAAAIVIGAAPMISYSRSDNNIINMGIIGTGDRGAWINYILKDIPDIRIIACCDILPDHLANGLKNAEPSAKSYQDYRRMIDNNEIDAVIVCTPLHLHYQMAFDALDGGKHVFCEKTMTYNIDQALKLVKAVKNSKYTFQVGYQTRCNPLHQKIKALIDDESCGQITHIRCNYDRNRSWRRKVDDPQNERLINWRMYSEFSGGLMAELCSHHIDIVNWILDTHPLKVCGFGGIDYWKDGRETFDNIQTIFEYPNGIKATFTAITTNAQAGKTLKFMGKLGTIEIIKEEGQEAFFYAERELREQQAAQDSTKEVDTVTSATRQAWERGEAVAITVDNQPGDDYITTGLAFKHFAECIKYNKEPNANVETGRQAAIAVHMGNMAMRNGTIEHWKSEYSQ